MKASLGRDIEAIAAKDPDRVLALSFADETTRPYLLSLIDFNADLAAIPEMVSEPSLAAIRLQFWADQLAKPPLAGFAHASLTHLSNHRQFAPIKAHLLALIAARIEALAASPFANQAAQDEALDDIYGRIIACALIIAGVGGQETLSDFARYAGRAWGLSMLMANVAGWQKRGSCWLVGHQHWPNLAALRPILKSKLPQLRANIALANQHLTQEIKAEPAAFIYVTLAKMIAQAAVKTDNIFAGFDTPLLLARQGKTLWAVILGRV